MKIIQLLMLATELLLLVQGADTTTSVGSTDRQHARVKREEKFIRNKKPTEKKETEKIAIESILGSKKLRILT